MIPELRDIINLGYSKPTPQLLEEYHKRLLENKNVQDYLKKRGFLEEIIKRFKLGINEKGDLAIPIFKDNELIDFKFRNILNGKNKRFYRYKGSLTWIFNEDAIEIAQERKKIIITEGELDAISLIQLGFLPTISIVGGAASAKNERMDWLSQLDFISKIYICFDNDEVGQEAARNFAERVGLEKCYNIILPTKDANEFLQKGYTTEEFQKLIQEAKRFNIKDVFKISEAIDRIKNKKLEKLPAFLDRINENTDGGIPKRSLVTLSGYTGQGKSTTLLNFLIEHANQEKPVLLISLENDIDYTIQRILEIKNKKRIQELNSKDYNLENFPFYIDISMNTFTMEKIQKITSQAKKLYGIEALGFDHIGFLPNRKFNVVQEIAQMSRDFKMMAVEKNIVVYLVSHVRKSLDSNRYLSGEELKDSSSLAQDSDIIIFILDSKNGPILYIDKARMSRSKLNIPIKFNLERGIIEDDFERDVTSFGMSINEQSTIKDDTGNNREKLF